MFFLIALLAGCGSLQTRLVCPPVIEWSATTQKAVRAELIRNKPENTQAIRYSLGIFMKQRDVLTKCQGHS